MFTSWGSSVHRRRWVVLVMVAALALLSGGWGLGVFDRLAQGGFEDPSSEAVRAAGIAEASLGRQSADLVVIYSAPPGRTVDDPQLAAAVTADLRELPSDRVAKVVSYFETGAAQLASADRGKAIAVITLSGVQSSTQLADFDAIEPMLSVDGVDTQLAGWVTVGSAINERSASDLATAEAISLPVTLVLLVIVFGGLIAATLPVIVGILTIVASLGVLRLLTMAGVEVNSFAVNVVTLLGLGLAIDYGLFMVGRFREELAAGRDTATAVRRTVATAGRTVAFSATLLAVALSGMLLFPQSFLKSLGYGGMAAVVIAALIALTLLPAMLALLGPRVNRLSIRWRRTARTDAGPSVTTNRWGRMAMAVMRRPLVVAVPIVTLLVLLGSPFLGIRFGEVTEKALPAGDPARVATELLAAEFPGLRANAAQVVVNGLDGEPDQAEVGGYLGRLQNLAGVDSARISGAGGTVVVIEAQLAGDPLGDDARATLTRVRDLTPAAGTEVLVGGPTARVTDNLASISARLPWMAALLVASTLLLMFLAFGSVLLPIKAVLASALSLSATFGALTWMFQDGHGASLLGITPGPLEASVVVLIAALVFGLSTDYETFLLSRMVEARRGGASSREAVAVGMASTGRVITAAALLLIVVTGAFAFSEVSMTRFVGVGMILALALDATVVRMLLVPALLRLLGDAAWWAPAWLRRPGQPAGPDQGKPGDDADPDTLKDRHRVPEPVG